MVRLIRNHAQHRIESVLLCVVSAWICVPQGLTRTTLHFEAGWEITDEQGSYIKPIWNRKTYIPLHTGVQTRNLWDRILSVNEPLSCPLFRENEDTEQAVECVLCVLGVQPQNKVLRYVPVPVVCNQSDEKLGKSPWKGVGADEFQASSEQQILPGNIRWTTIW